MTERPKSGFEFLVSAVGGALLLGLSGWLLSRTVASYQAYQVIGAVCLGALALYLGYQAWSLQTCLYRLEGPLLTLQQGMFAVEVDLTAAVGLHRWKAHWMWSHALRDDLGISQVQFYPALSFFREPSTWVLTYTGEGGEPQAVVFRPSARLLHLLRHHRRAMHASK